jgi:hypothetical protein
MQAACCRTPGAHHPAMLESAADPPPPHGNPPPQPAAAAATATPAASVPASPFASTSQNLLQAGGPDPHLLEPPAEKDGGQQSLLQELGAHPTGNARRTDASVAEVDDNQEGGHDTDEASSWSTSQFAWQPILSAVPVHLHPPPTTLDLPIRTTSATAAFYDQHCHEVTLFNVGLVGDASQSGRVVRVAGVDLAVHSDWFRGYINTRAEMMGDEKELGTGGSMMG